MHLKCSARAHGKQIAVIGHAKLRTPTVTSCSATSRKASQADQTTHSLTRVFASMAAAALMLTSSPMPATAEELYAAGPSQYNYPAAERYAEQQEKRFDENLQTQELKDLLSLLQKGNMKLSDLDAARLKVWVCMIGLWSMIDPIWAARHAPNQDLAVIPDSPEIHKGAM
jgi:hypothetical protein